MLNILKFPLPDFWLLKPRISKRLIAFKRNARKIKYAELMAAPEHFKRDIGLMEGRPLRRG